MATFEEIRALSKLPEKTVPLCLRGDLQAEYEELERQLKAAKARRGGTLSGSGDDVKALEEQVKALKEQMADSTVVFTLRGVTRSKWSNLKAEHAPRDEDQVKGIDYHGEEFPVAAVQACLIDPALTIKEVEQLVDEVFTQGQWDALFWQTWILNQGTVEVPT
ncbi:hypothetical protein IMZ11_02305 [Microtetraspora sp. AC03309]|uniref:hypothetical protein n=1 Tax=Microtetraspora sp. AC03309 TaxID=2779376 RepID=UPI001E5C7ED0|nr:hypothetical protein [Microtetraspora sp. AC03309]MCC5574473.1 hypothetical protein [Microtetraspora sp. AC03309]